jgi:hypothetical protein
VQRRVLWERVRGNEQMSAGGPVRVFAVAVETDAYPDRGKNNYFFPAPHHADIARGDQLMTDGSIKRRSRF